MIDDELAGRVTEATEAWVERDESETPADAEIAKKDAALVRVVLAAATDEDEVLARWEDGEEADWLVDVAFDLANVDLFDEAVGLLDALAAKVPGLADFPAARAHVLASGGRLDEARAAMNAILAEGPEDTEQLFRVIETMAKVDAPRAEKVARQLLSEATDLLDVLVAGEVLVELLRGRGEEVEATDVERTMQRALEAAPTADAPLVQLPISPASAPARALRAPREPARRRARGA